jgi:Ca-activated chloride channel family protein
MFSL